MSDHEPLLQVIMHALLERGWEQQDAENGTVYWVLPGMNRPFSLTDAITAQTMREIAETEAPCEPRRPAPPRAPRSRRRG
jgi:hypothetical protein